jgi:hypothetical protein
MSLYLELKRRNVFRVGAAYIVAAWLVIQVAETVFPLFGFDDTPARIVVIVLAIGFPLFLVFSWVFEFTPEGLKRETEVDRSASTTHKTGKHWRLIRTVHWRWGPWPHLYGKMGTWMRRSICSGKRRTLTR